MALKASAAALIIVFLVQTAAQAEECRREAFAGVVNEASAELTAMNEANKKLLLEKLQLLKARSGWSEAEFGTQAAPFIKDDRIAGYDAESKALLAKVPELGGAAANPSVASLAGAAPGLNMTSERRCAMMKELRQLMSAVVENSRSKWAYMFARLDAALEKSNAGKADH